MTNSSCSLSWAYELQRSEEVANRKYVCFKQLFTRVSWARGFGISYTIHLDCSQAPLGLGRKSASAEGMLDQVIGLSTR